HPTQDHTGRPREVLPMSVVPMHADGEHPVPDGSAGDRARDDTPGRDGGAEARQAAWFGLADVDESATAAGVFAGVVFNRPIEQVLTYRVPSRFERLIQAGQRVRAPLGRGDKLAVGYCVRIDRQAPEGLDRLRIKELVEILDPSPLIDRRMLELTRWVA